MIQYAASADHPEQIYRRDGFTYSLWNYKLGTWCSTCYDASVFFYDEENSVSIPADEVAEYIRKHTP